MIILKLDKAKIDLDIKVEEKKICKITLFPLKMYIM